jgi:hypothetical protein
VALTSQREKRKDIMNFSCRALEAGEAGTYNLCSQLCSQLLGGISRTHSLSLDRTELVRIESSVDIF